VTTTPRILWTIGYENFPTPVAMRDVLEECGIEWVCDVRALPQSRRPGFSRHALRDVLADAGIVYEHRPELGNPAPLREVFRAGRLEEGREAFRAHLLGAHAWAVDVIAERIDERPTAMLCREDDPALCHRGVIIEELVRRNPNVRVVRVPAGPDG
jgi:uncharacterized protein (DUF488 family)